jgi:CheY-like chemotaxis protein
MTSADLTGCTVRPQFWRRRYRTVAARVLPYWCSAVHTDPNAPADLPTVLIMDDEPLVRQAARRFLGESGYGCVEAESVDAALKILRTTPVIAAMLDMRLPDGRTGLDVLTDLRRITEFRDIPVLIVTGSILSDTEVAAIVKQRGFVFFKPEGFSIIVNFLDRLTGRDRSS